MTRTSLVAMSAIFTVSLLFGSCGENPQDVGNNISQIALATEAAQKHFRNFDVVTLEDLGAIHNEILDAFEDLHPLMKGDRLRRDEFVQLFVQASNNVMVAHEYPTTFNTEDINVLLECFDGYTEAGVYDFYGERESDPYAMLDYLYNKGELTDSEYHDYVAMYDELYGRTPEPGASRSENSIENSSGARQVLIASQQFWSSHGIGSMPGLKGLKNGQPQLNLDWYSLGIVAADAMGAIITHRLLPGGNSQIEAMGAALTSAAFIALAGGGDGSGGDGGSGGGGGGAG
jgi:hypothetical protein